MEKIMIESMTAYVLAMMALSWTLTSKLPGQTPKDVAVAIATASVEKPLFQDEDGPRQTAALMTAIARYESGFDPKAKGDCKDKPPGWPGCGKEKGSEPTSFCFGQIHLVDGAKTVEGWTSDDLLADPLKCARSMREILRTSIKASPSKEPLLMYAGRSKEANTRFELAKKLFKLVPWTIRCD
jgi:hypothetical protein